MTGHPRVPEAKMGLEWARPVEGIAGGLAEAVQLKRDPLAPFSTELPLIRHTRVPAA